MISKKIVFLSMSLKKGGAENQLVKLAVYLSDLKYDVEIIHLISGNDFITTTKAHGIRVFFVNIKSWSGFRSYAKHIKHSHVDLLISFMFGANIVARFTKLHFGIPLITSVRNNEISNLYKILYYFTKHIDDVTTFNSQHALDKFINMRLTIKSKSCLINNAIEITSYERPKKDNDVFKLVSIAHFRPQKDYKTLFNAVKKVKDNGKAVRLYVLGHLFDQKWPTDMLVELGLENDVRLIGFTNDPSGYLDQADALVLSSKWEGTPNAILEGMAHKLPIIASNIPGSQGLVINSDAGFLFEVGNSTHLAKQIMKMMELSPVNREELGTNGFTFVRENFEAVAVHAYWHELVVEQFKGQL